MKCQKVCKQGRDDSMKVKGQHLSKAPSLHTSCHTPVGKHAQKLNLYHLCRY